MRGTQVKGNPVWRASATALAVHLVPVGLPLGTVTLAGRGLRRPAAPSTLVCHSLIVWPTRARLRRPAPPRARYGTPRRPESSRSCPNPQARRRARQCLGSGSRRTPAPSNTGYIQRTLCSRGGVASQRPNSKASRSGLADAKAPMISSKSGPGASSIALPDGMALRSAMKYWHSSDQLTIRSATRGSAMATNRLAVARDRRATSAWKSIPQSLSAAVLAATIRRVHCRRIAAKVPPPRKPPTPER